MPRKASRYRLVVEFQAYWIKEKLDLALAEEDYAHVNWEKSKRFTNGALVGISADKFETIIFATVWNRNAERLKNTGLL